MSASTVVDSLKAHLVDLQMPGGLEVVDTLLERLDYGAISPVEAMEQLLAAQVALRRQRQLQAVLHSSRLPGVKALDTFDFACQPSIDRAQILSLHWLGFLEPKEKVTFLGSAGVGKTHLAVSLAITAAERGRRVYYGTLTALVLSGGSGRPGTAKGAAGSPHCRRDRLPPGNHQRGQPLLPLGQYPLRT